MAVTVSLNQYHHIVIVAQNAGEAVRLWSKVFNFAEPKLNDLGPIFKKFNDPQYPSLLRGKRWDSDFKQAVFHQHSYFFEIDEPGTDDNFSDFTQKHGNGVAYIGLIAGEKRNAFLKRLEDDYGCETVLEQYFPGGDWSVNYTEKLLGIDLCVKKLPGGDHTDHPVMLDFAGLTVLVDALDEKLAAWKEIFGAKKIKSRIEKMTVNYLGADCEVTVKAAEISDGLLPVDLIEAGKNGPFADYFRAHGSGVFQISIPSSDDYRKKTAAALEAEGMDELLRYELFGKRYTVYNTVDRMGANIALA